jgi:hypothetical protein
MTVSVIAFPQPDRGEIVAFVDLGGKDERARFQREALAAVDRLLGKGSAS